MRTSVLISTYNATTWLEKVLWSYFNQTVLDFEIIIADDGSKPETAALIARISAELVQTPQFDLSATVTAGV